MSLGHYILDDNNQPVLADMMEWATFYQTKKRFLRKDQKANIVVSTVFLGLDHNFDLEGPPILFESMVFDNGNECDCWRYVTFSEAIDGHKELCRKYDIFYMGTNEDVINTIDDLDK